MSLFTRTYLVLMATALGPLLATGAWFLQSNEKARENARRMHQQLTQLSADAVETSIGELNRSIAFVEDFERETRRSLPGNAAADRTPPRGSAEAEYRVLQGAAATHPEFSLLSLLDASGMETARIADAALFPDMSPVRRSSEPIVREALRTGKVGLSPVLEQSGKPVVSIAYPLPRGRTLYVVYNLQSLWRRIGGLRAGASGRLLLLGTNGRPLPGIAKDFPEPDWRGPGPLPAPSGWLEKLPTASGTMVGAYATTPSLGWVVLSLQPRDEAFATGERFVFTAMAFLLSLTFLVGMAAYWTAGRLTAPLLSLIAAARSVSRNEFNLRLPELGWGELNLLSKSFNEMTSKLKAYQGLQVERLLEEKAKVDSLVHTIPDGILLAGLEGEILYMNGAAASILGVRVSGSLQGRSVRDVLRQGPLLDMAQSLLRRERRSASMEAEFKRASAERPEVYSCRAVTVMRDTRELGILILLRDVTGERDLDRMKEEFLHSIVHDLRNPLSSIHGFMQILNERGQMGDREKRYLPYVMDSCRDLQQLVTEILDIAKLESGQMQLKPEPLPVEEMLSKLHSLFAIQSETRGVQIAYELGRELSEPPLCDRELVLRVAMNLIGNSLKFTPKGGRVTVTAGLASSPGELEVCVADTGPGIPKDKLEFVFQKFKQLDKEARARSGYGLGLAICRKIVELHGGRIWAESEEGRGSRFLFRIPLRPPVAAAPAPGAVAKPA